MHSWPILTFLIALPLVGALLLLLMPQQDTPRAAARFKLLALLVSLGTLALAACLWAKFETANANFQFVEFHEWFAGYNIAYHLGVDGISLFFVVLTAFLTPICILASWGAITTRVRDFMVSFLVLEALVIGVFAALDFLLFYLFFEAMLIPMYLIIGIWGGEKRVYAAFKFFLYTLLGSVLLLLALLFVYMKTGTMNIPVLMEILPTYGLNVQQWLWLAMFASFAVKVPMWPVHTWLPDAHVQAPTAGSVILAGILLKMGGYGFLRFSLPMLPEASLYFMPLMLVLSVVAVIYTSLVALMQTDMKKLIAYSSIAHMGIVTLGLFTFNVEGISGSIVQMLSHGLVSGALFLCVGVLYDRIHTKEINRYGGLVHRMPIFAFLFLFFTMASVGLPGTSGFVGEIMVLLGAYQISTWATAGAATGMVLGAAYMLWLYRRVMFGALTKPELQTITDVNAREIFTFLPMVGLVLWMGIYPAPITNVLEPSVKKLLWQMCRSEGLRSYCPPTR
jgi:NADH-quinone oxidoreductase subunit M